MAVVVDPLVSDLPAFTLIAVNRSKEVVVPVRSTAPLTFTVWLPHDGGTAFPVQVPLVAQLQFVQLLEVYVAAKQMETKMNTRLKDKQVLNCKDVLMDSVWILGSNRV